MRGPRLPRRSDLLDSAAGPGAFWWAAGIEDTFITTPHPATGRTLDEYELTDHYRRWAEDIDLMADLKVGAARYGLPWHRLQASPRSWSWELADRPIERLLAHGIEPQIDLVHYGLPGWIEGGFLNPDFPQLMAEYAAAVAERYRGRVHWYTPLNEPRITAWYCGRIGWWPPFGRSLDSFVAVMLALCRGIKATVAALRSVDPEIVDYHVDATDLYAAADPSLKADVRARQEIVFLALDLLSGKVDEQHPLRDWLARHGAPPGEVERFRESPVRPPIVGLNLYPMFTRKVVLRDQAGRLRIRMPYADETLVDRLARMYHARYGAPLAISETATRGSVRRRLDWLDRSVAACRRLRADGVPVCGYTWWPLFSLVAWAYRQGQRPVAEHLLRMGLWDLESDSFTGELLARRRTSVADRFAAYAGGAGEAAQVSSTPAAR